MFLLVKAFLRYSKCTLINITGILSESQSCLSCGCYNEYVDDMITSTEEHNYTFSVQRNPRQNSFS